MKGQAEQSPLARAAVYRAPVVEEDLLKLVCGVDQSDASWTFDDEDATRSITRMGEQEGVIYVDEVEHAFELTGRESELSAGDHRRQQDTECASQPNAPGRAARGDLLCREHTTKYGCLAVDRKRLTAPRGNGTIDPGVAGPIRPNALHTLPRMMRTKD